MKLLRALRSLLGLDRLERLYERAGVGAGRFYWQRHRGSDGVDHLHRALGGSALVLAQTECGRDEAPSRALGDRLCPGCARRVEELIELEEIRA